MSQYADLEYFRYRVRRDLLAVRDWFLVHWREKLWFKLLAVASGLFLALMVIGWAVLASNLPDTEGLVGYETPLPTMVRGSSCSIPISRQS